jgi:hypothetical protein
LNGLSLFKRTERSRAREQASIAADREISESFREAELESTQLQKEWDDWWQLIWDNDPEAVLELLNWKFEDSESRAAAVDVQGSEADLVVLVPGLEFIPERMPKIGPSGRLAWPSLTRTERSAWYDMMVCGHLLNTVREVLATAPEINVVTAAAVRFGDPDVYDNPVWSVFLPRTSVARDLTVSLGRPLRRLRLSLRRPTTFGGGRLAAQRSCSHST